MRDTRPSLSRSRLKRTISTRTLSCNSAMRPSMVARSTRSGKSSMEDAADPIFKNEVIKGAGKLYE